MTNVIRLGIDSSMQSTFFPLVVASIKKHRVLLSDHNCENKSLDLTLMELTKMKTDSLKTLVHPNPSRGA